MYVNMHMNVFYSSCLPYWDNCLQFSFLPQLGDKGVYCGVYRFYDQSVEPTQTVCKQSQVCNPPGNSCHPTGTASYIKLHTKILNSLEKNLVVLHVFSKPFTVLVLVFMISGQNANDKMPQPKKSIQNILPQP